MSRDNLKAFYQKFRIDLSLQEKLDGITYAEDYVAKAIEVGAAEGFEFTVAEVEEALANPSELFEESVSGELTDLELGVVAGGGFGKPPKLENTDIE